jgi:hypothetical protein
MHLDQLDDNYCHAKLSFDLEMYFMSRELG